VRQLHSIPIVLHRAKFRSPPLTPGDMIVRSPDAAEIPALARLWHQGWHDAHAAIVPDALVRARTLENFHQRLEAGVEDLRVLGQVGSPLGFFALKGDELYQFYVAAEARGSGMASALIASAEAMLREQGTETAWLSCAIGNARAARFYEKSGWHRVRTFIDRLTIPKGTFDLEVWRYEKQLAPSSLLA
jgi:GNAT superfamily N-acetyltransferase